MLIGDLIDLDAPELEDRWADSMPARLVEKRNQRATAMSKPEPTKTADGLVDEDSDWDFWF